MGGVCKFDGTEFEDFSIPYPKVETKINPDTKDWISSITEDSKGHIWFGRDGYGASKFDHNSFVHFTTKEGLNSNNVQSIAADQEGNIWIGTRVAEKDHADPNKRFGKGGLNKYDGQKIVQFPGIKGLNERDVFAIYKDHSKDLWISTTSNGVYKYAYKEFVNYKVPASTTGFLQDKKGNVWLGCAGGLYKIDKDDNNKYLYYPTTKAYVGKDSIIWVGTMEKVFGLKNNAFISIGREEMGGQNNETPNHQTST